MGLIDNVIKFASLAAGNAKCIAGYHDWSLWSYSASDKCEQTRYCKRSGCTKRESQTVHVWPKYDYHQEGNCEQRRTCFRGCGSYETGSTVHLYSNWKLKDGMCEEVRSCTRCNKATEERSVTHQWAEWKLVEALCKEVRRCKHCPATEARLVPHLWSAWKVKADVCKEARSCARCPSVEERSVRHEWGEWIQPVSDKCAFTRTCTHCKAQDHKEEHAWGIFEHAAPAGPMACVQVRFCRRCKDAEDEKPEEDSDHKWVVKSTVNCLKAVCECERCCKISTRQVKSNKHVWTEWEPKLFNHRKLERKCNTCFETEVMDSPHSARS